MNSGTKKLMAKRFDVVADWHKAGMPLPEIFRKQNDYLNQLIGGNSSLYKESYYLNSWLLAYAQRDNEVVFLRFIDNDSRENSGCIALLCLKVRRSNFGTSYTNGGILFGYPGPVITPGMEPEFFILLKQWLSQQKGFWRCELGPTLDSLHQKCDIKSIGKITSSFSPVSAPVIELSPDYQPPSKSLQQNIRTKTNSLQKIDYSFYLCRNTSDPMFNTLIDAWVTMLQKRWPNGHFSNDRERHLKFHLLLAHELSENNNLLLAALIIDGEPAAIIYGVLQKDRFYFFNTAMNAKYAKFSPSMLLINHLLLRLKEEISIFDFMNNMEPYKLQWATTVIPRYKFELYSHFFVASSFRYRWGPKYLIPKIFKFRDFCGLVRNPLPTIKKFMSVN